MMMTTMNPWGVVTLREQYNAQLSSTCVGSSITRAACGGSIQALVFRLFVRPRSCRWSPALWVPGTSVTLDMDLLASRLNKDLQLRNSMTQFNGIITALSVGGRCNEYMRLHTSCHAVWAPRRSPPRVDTIVGHHSTNSRQQVWLFLHVAT